MTNWQEDIDQMLERIEDGDPTTIEWIHMAGTMLLSISDSLWCKAEASADAIENAWCLLACMEERYGSLWVKGHDCNRLEYCWREMLEDVPNEATYSMSIAIIEINEILGTKKQPDPVASAWVNGIRSILHASISLLDLEFRRGA